MPHDLQPHEQSMADVIRKYFPDKQEQLKDVIWIAELFDEHSKLIATLKSDVDNAIDEVSSSPKELGQYRLRTLVRTLFASIEGNIAVFKQTMLGCYKVGLINLEIRDIAKLIEDELTFNDQLVKPKRLPLKDLVKFIFMIFARKISKQEFQIDTNSSGWKAFCESIKIRDRLMHPKSNNDMMITGQEGKSLVLATKWFFNTSTMLLKQPIKVFKQDGQKGGHHAP